MSGPPRIEITGGAPTPEEEAAVAAAIIDVWRRQRAEAAREAVPSRWAVAARAAATGNAIIDLRRDAGGEAAWRLSQRVAGFGLVAARRTGRGDSK